MAPHVLNIFREKSGMRGAVFFAEIVRFTE